MTSNSITQRNQRDRGVWQFHTHVYAFYVRAVGITLLLFHLNSHSEVNNCTECVYLRISQVSYSLSAKLYGLTETHDYRITKWMESLVDIQENARVWMFRRILWFFSVGLSRGHREDNESLFCESPGRNSVSFPDTVTAPKKFSQSADARKSTPGGIKLALPRWLLRICVIPYQLYTPAGYIVYHTTQWCDHYEIISEARNIIHNLTFFSLLQPKCLNSYIIIIILSIIAFTELLQLTTLKTLRTLILRNNYVKKTIKLAKRFQWKVHTKHFFFLY